MSFTRSHESANVDRNRHSLNCYQGDNVSRYQYTQQYRRQDTVDHDPWEGKPTVLDLTTNENLGYDRRTDLAEQSKRYSFRYSSRRTLEAERSDRKLQAKADLSNRRSEQTIEVFPGEYMRLRGADETWSAIQDSFYTSCKCICCPTLELYCIQDADFVLCPACKAVSPLDSQANGDRPGEGGIGLGFQSQDLKIWQREIQTQKHTSSGTNFD